MLGFCAARPAAAQDLTYTLMGVTFSDGAIASGSFVYNPTTDIFDPHDITSTNGLMDTLTGYHYIPSDDNPGDPGGFPPSIFIIAASSTFPDYHDLLLSLSTGATSPGVYQLQPGVFTTGGQLGNSQEGIYLGNNTFTSRSITTGSLVVTPTIAPAPEPSQFAALGVGVLGLTGLILKVRKRQAVC